MQTEQMWLDFVVYNACAYVMTGLGGKKFIVYKNECLPIVHCIVLHISLIQNQNPGEHKHELWNG